MATTLEPAKHTGTISESLIRSISDPVVDAAIEQADLEPIFEEGYIKLSQIIPSVLQHIKGKEEAEKQYLICIARLALFCSKENLFYEKPAGEFSGDFAFRNTDLMEAVKSEFLREQYSSQIRNTIFTMEFLFKAIKRCLPCSEEDLLAQCFQKGCHNPSLTDRLADAIFAKYSIFQNQNRFTREPC